LIFGSTPEISFNFPQKELSLYWNKFLAPEIGKIYQVIPWNGLVQILKLTESRKGRSAYFSPMGNLQLDKTQHILAKAWKPYIK
jgi:hypothetical protein